MGDPLRGPPWVPLSPETWDGENNHHFLDFAVMWGVSEPAQSDLTKGSQPPRAAAQPQRSGTAKQTSREPAAKQHRQSGKRDTASSTRREPSGVSFRRLGARTGVDLAQLAPQRGASRSLRREGGWGGTRWGPCASEASRSTLSAKITLSFPLPKDIGSPRCSCRLAAGHARSACAGRAKRDTLAARRASRRGEPWP